MVKKLIVLILFLISAQTVVAAPRIAGASASMVLASSTSEAGASRIDSVRTYAAKKRAITHMLEKYNSPMLPHVDTFVHTCMTYNLDCYLLPAIAGLESSFGRYTAPGSNNAFGWGGGHIHFADWSDGIDTVGRGLRQNYIRGGEYNLSTIGRVYSESPTWAVRVSGFMAQMQTMEQKELQNGDFSLE